MIRFPSPVAGLAASLTFFLAAGYLIRPNPLWAALGFYALVLPALLLALIQNSRVREVLQDKSVLLGFALMAWFALTLVWGVDQTPRRVVGYAIGIPLNAAFFAASVAVFALAEERWHRLLLWAVAAAAALNVAVTLLPYAIGFMPEGLGVARLRGWAETRHPILGAGVAAIGMQAACALTLLNRAASARLPALGCATLAGLFVVATGSRGPMLSALAFLVVFGMAAFGWRGVLVAGVLAASSALAALVLLGADWIATQIERPSNRLPIWEDTLSRISEQPLLGHGVANVATFGSPEWTFPHSLYLSAVYYGGLPGGVLVVGVLLAAVSRAFRIGHFAWRAWALGGLAGLSIFGITDLGQPAGGASELWYILWLPVAAAVGLGRHAAHATRFR